jgi:hypothetical protein
VDHNGGVSTPHRGYQTIVRPTLSTTRTSVDLLGLAWPFSQVRLLTQDEFLRQAADRRVRVGGYRGHDLNRSALEELHRVGVLVPLYRVDLANPSPDRVVDVSASRNSHGGLNTVPGELYLAAVDGRLHDPAAEPFQPWPGERRRAP